MMNNHIRNDYDCWFAQWYTKPTSYKYNRLGIWQYGGETNYLNSPAISGVGVIDQNFCYKDYPTIIKNGGYNGFKKQASTNTSTSTTSNTSSTTSTANDMPMSIYRIRTGGKWLPEVFNLEDYAGIVGKPITDIMVKFKRGTVKYRVHIKGGNWLPYVTGYNIKDDNNGYAGNGKPIDAIEIYYNTPNDLVKSKGYYKAKYRVSPTGENYYGWQYDNEKIGGQDGYAGAFGKTIDRLQITLSK